MSANTAPAPPSSPPRGPDDHLRVDEGGRAWYWDAAAAKWISQLEVERAQAAEEPRPATSDKSTADKPASVGVGEKRGRPNHFVVLSGLPEDVTEEELLEFVSKCGLVKKDPYTGDTQIHVSRRARPAPAAGTQDCEDPKGTDGGGEDEEWICTGTAVVQYYRPESVALALSILDEAYLRDKPVRVSEAEEEHRKLFHRKRSKKQKKKIVVDQSKELSWEEENRVHVVLKGMYRPEDAFEDVDFFKELEAEVRTECEKLGPVETLTTFPYNPEGVVAIKFGDPEAAKMCIEVMNGRFFAGQRLSAEYYDGKENFHRDETAEMRERRDAAWKTWLEGDDDGDE